MNPALELNLGSWWFSPSLLVLLTLAALVLITLQASWRAGRRLGDRAPIHRWSIVGLNLVAGGAVALLLLSPSHLRQANDTIVLVTEGAENRPGDDPNPLAGQRYLLDTGFKLTSEDLDVALTTPGQLLLRQPGLDTLQVLGHGLDESQWRDLPAELKVRHDPPPLAGPLQVQWTPQLALGEALTVTGVLQLEAADQVARLELLDPAGIVVDSTSARSGQAFSLTTTPRGTGPLDYRLRGGRGDQDIFSEPVGVFIEAERGARLLVIQSAPSFETRRLANWAGDQGHALVIHSQVSQDRDLVQGINLETDAPLDRTSSLYSDMDLALLDGRRWAGLADAERETILRAVRSGLGLVLLADAELADWLGTGNHADQLGLELKPVAGGEPRWPAWPGFEAERPLPLAPFRLEAVGARALTLDETGTTLEAWQPLGEGRIMVSLLRERHRWVTSGESSSFARYWARLLRQVAREMPGSRWLAPAADVRPRAGQRLDLCAIGGEGTLDFAPRSSGIPEPRTEALTTATTAMTTARSAALVPHAAGTNLNCGVVWPRQAGWHVAQLRDPDGTLEDTLFLEVYDADAWRTDAAARRQLATQARAGSSMPDTPAGRQVWTPLSPWWAWGVLLLSAGALWLERRLFDLT